MKLREESSLDEAEVRFFSDLQNLVHLQKISLPKDTTKVCSVDAYYHEKKVVAVATLFVNGRLFETTTYRGCFTFPYASGLLYLHEGPFVVQAVRKLKTIPQLVCFDGHGSAHPRSAGLAKICGAILAIPSIGLAKSLLVGTLLEYKGELEKIVFRGEPVGFVTRSPYRRYWSAGYSVSLIQLESIIRRYGLICLRAMAESDRLSRSEMSR